MRNPLEVSRPGLRARGAPDGYDDGRRTACRSLVAGPVRAGAARRLVELVLGPRDHRDELAEIFDEIDDVAAAPTLERLTGVAARATAAHTWRGTRSLGASAAVVSAGIDRRFAACESGEAGYPLILAGLGAAGRYGLENNLSPVYLTHTLARIVESALLCGTVIDPACAPGAYTVRLEPRNSTTDAVRATLGDHLAREQNTTIDFALEELTSGQWREPGVIDHLQSLLLAVRGPIDIQQLVVAAHSLLASACPDVEIEAELVTTAGVLDGSGLTGGGSLALGGAVGAITGLVAGVVASCGGDLSGAGAGAGGGGRAGGAGAGAAEAGAAARAGGAAAEPGGLLSRRPGPSPPGGDRGPRAVLRVALVVAWCAEHGRIRPGTITIDRRRRGGRQVRRDPPGPPA